MQCDFIKGFGWESAYFYLLNILKWVPTRMKLVRVLVEESAGGILQALGVGGSDSIPPFLLFFTRPRPLD